MYIHVCMECTGTLSFAILHTCKYMLSLAHTQRKKHYWRLDTKCLTLYKSDTSSQYYKEIALADILAVDPMVNPEVYPLNPPHVFEIVTSSMTFYVGVDMTGALPRDLLQKAEGMEMEANHCVYQYVHVVLDYCITLRV